MHKNNVFIIIVVISFFYSTCVIGQADTSGWKEEKNIYEKVYDATLTGHNLHNTKLYQSIHQNPTILVLIFTRCTGICNPFLLQLKENMQFEAGYKTIKILVISFDPRDTKEDMNLFAERFGLNNDKQWIFAVTDQISNLNRSVGFNPVWDSTRNQYDHDALLVGINREGYITKKLIGLRNEHELKLLINSINDVFAPTYRIPNQNQLFSCFNYNSKTGRNTPGLGLFFVGLPVVITVLILFLINYIVHSNRIFQKN
ncbi:hypothetical protein GALL_244170 [mine drainage metagenome]|uniref:Thioredoxin domain-containing protein n=1 Tax=mine drainage metagenome TaxID=410659 RepID=A0A1J5RE75_9ZZZZ